MSQAASGSILRGVPGRIIWQPTDLGIETSFGGTLIGMIRETRFRPNPKYREIWAEELGSVHDVIYCGEGPCELTGILRYPDDDAISTVAPKSVSSGSVGRHWLFRPGGTTANTRAGTALTPGKLLFAPKAVNAHPMILLYNAVPTIAPEAMISMSYKDEYGLAIRFVGTPDSSGRVYDCGRRGSLVL